MNLRSAPGIACLTLVLAACSSAVGDADAGPNSGGGYYDGPNVNVGPWTPGAAAMRAGHIQLRGGEPADQRPKRSPMRQWRSDMRILVSVVALAVGFVLGAIGSSPDCFTTLDCTLPHFILALSTR